ncbi:restriction endonuclease subunit S [Klebsiella variicola]|uniref:restriction endonuclease subunit S n=1 Tax=Klebsiella variicola TaxID=244366 RepID=UPI0018687275|nr:restriction endonuclease subunit S [Klebsiella variicola]MBG2046669.1 restriction endonuclease subunit S [Klebsiella variicola]
MDAQQFLAEFGHIANAPGGICKLRELILQLAVQGKLIVYTASDVSSRVLLDEIRALKAELVSCKKLPRQKPYPEVLRREIAVDAPSHWEWAHFGELWQLLSGRDLEPSKYNDSKNGIPYITGASNIVNGIIVVNRWTPDPVVISISGDLLITCKGTIGKTVFNTLGEVHIARQIMAIRDFSKKLDTGFLKIWLDGFVSQLVEKSKSMIPGFSRDDLELAAYPVLPIEEQSRIVAKVEELMALCDKLEAQQQARRKLQNALRQSILQAVASASSPHELQTTWTLLADNFGWLFHTPEDVKDLRNLIFQLGIQGLIVEQCETDSEKAIEFIRSVQTKKDRLVNSGVIRRTTSFPTVEEKEEPFTLPRGWVFCRLGEVSICRDGQRIPLSKSEREPRRGKFPYYGASGIIDHIDDFIFEEDLLLVGEDGANLVNRSTPIAFIATGRYWVNNHAHVLDTVNGVALRYLELYINAIDLKPYVTGTAQPKMNQEKMNLIVVAVPPPEEQARIVERIDKLMRFCDTLEKTLFNAVETVERFAISTIASLTGIAIEQEEEPMKAPQTELIAPLCLGTEPNIKAQAPLATILARHHGEMSAKDLWHRFGGEIDAFYAQLKIEVMHGWILEPAPAEVREKPSDTVSA